MKKRTARTLSTLLAILVLVTVGSVLYQRWFAEFDTPKEVMTLSDLHLRSFLGTAPKDFGGLSYDRTVYVTKNSLHTLEYWRELTDHANYGDEPYFTGLTRVQYAYNDVRNAYVELTPMLRKWAKEYTFKMDVAVAQHLYEGPEIRE